MKNALRSWVVVFAVLMAFARFDLALGQSTSLPPIWSQDVLRQAMLANVVRGVRSVYADSINWGQQGSVTLTNVVGSGAENVLDKLMSAELIYSLANENDMVRGYIYLYDKYDVLLFFGSADYTLAQLRRNLKPTYGIWMQTAPILENVLSAEVLALDEDGKTARRIPLLVDEYGRAQLQPYLAGSANGILSVRMQDGTLVTYQLSSPIARIPDGNVDTATMYKIDGHHVFTDPTSIKIIETWQRPTVYLRISATAEFQPIAIDVLGLVQEGNVPIFERPISMTVIREVPGFTPITFELDPESPRVLNWPIGTYRIYFGWRKFGQPGMIYSGPIEDNGRG